MRRRRPLAAASVALVFAVFAVALGVGDARAGGFLDDVEAGRSAVRATAAATRPDSAAARATAARDVVADRAPASAGFALGATLAALDADLARDPGARSGTDRAIVAQQVRELLAAQAAAGIGNRALCLLSGRTEPKSLERQVRLVEPRWSCDRDTEPR